MLYDFNFFEGADDFSKDDVLLEALDIRLANMQKGTFQRVLDRELKPFLSKNDVQITNVTIPRNPKREQNPQSKEHLQSFRVTVVFSDSQRMQWLIQYIAQNANDKISDPNLKGFVAEIKINGQVMPLNTLGADKYGRIAADASSLKKLRDSIIRALESNHEDYKQRQQDKIDQTGADKSTKTGQSDEAQELAKKMRNKNLGKDGEAPKRLSRAAQLEQKQREVEEGREALHAIQMETDAFVGQETTLQNREQELQDEIAALNERLMMFDESEIS